jgi:hypothetical protein
VGKVPLAGRFRDVFGYPPEQVLSPVAFMLSESVGNVHGRDDEP